MGELRDEPTEMDADSRLHRKIQELYSVAAFAANAAGVPPAAKIMLTWR
jgi:hypothetical protein